MDDELEQKVIKDEMEQTREALASKIEKLTSKVEDGVQEATQVVENVQKAVDLPYQVTQNPWIFIGGSVAVGFLASRLLMGPSHSHRGNSHAFSQPAYAPAAVSSPTPPTSSPSGASSWLNSMGMGGIGEMIETELEKVKGVAIGTAVAFIRDLISEAVPETMKQKVSEMATDLTHKLGGEPVKEPVMPGLFHPEHSSSTGSTPNWQTRPV